MSTKFDLDFAIQHCEGAAKDYEDSIGTEAGSRYSLIHDKNCMKCAQEHRQLAEWLRELKKYKELFGSPEEAARCLNGYMV